MRPTIPSEILALGHARSAARRARDFREADRLRADIEAAGYRVVDRGTEFVISPAHPVDIEEEGRTRYGWSGAVPSRLGETSECDATLVLVADSGVEPLRRTLEGLRAHESPGIQVVIVAPPDPELDGAWAQGDLLAPIAGRLPDMVWTAVRLRPAAARNAGARRATGRIVIWVQTGTTITGDIVSPLVAALADATVAVAGAVGLTGTDIRRLEPGPAGPAVAIDRTVLAFRREELRAFGPLDERFYDDDQVDRWWSLVLRDSPQAPGLEAAPIEATAVQETPPRRAIAIDLPIDAATAVAPAPEPVDGDEAARRRKRDLYRLIDRFSSRPDLLRPPPARE